MYACIESLTFPACLHHHLPCKRTRALAAAAPHLLRKPVKTADPERAGDSRASSSDSSHHSSHHSASGSQARPGAGRRRSGSPPPPGHDHQDHSGGSGGGSLLHKLSRGSIGGGSTGINGAGGGSSARDSRGASTCELQPRIAACACVSCASTPSSSLRLHPIRRARLVTLQLLIGF